MKKFPEGPWFNEIAGFLGPAYLRNAFTTTSGHEGSGAGSSTCIT
ncbi:MAG: hypothetical protein ACXVKA_08225 [Acidimicrobiia bacterium]